MYLSFWSRTIDHRIYVCKLVSLVRGYQYFPDCTYLEEEWIFILYPFELLCLAADELILWISLHVSDLCGEASRAFSDGLVVGPQPSGVNVTVSYGKHLRLSISRPSLAESRSEFTATGPRVGIIHITRIDDLVRTQERSRATRTTLWQILCTIFQKLHVASEAGGREKRRRETTSLVSEER